MKVLREDNYRAFLKAKFLEMKVARPRHSIGVLARKVGCSESFIKKLFAEKVHLGYRFADKMATSLGLSQEEEELLFLIVIYHAVQDDRPRQLMARIIDEFKRSQLSGG